MPDSRIRLEIEDDIAVLTIDRPERRNALAGPMWTAIGEEVTRAAAERPRALILTGAGEHFCAGMDLKPDNPLAEKILPAVMEKQTELARSVIEELKGCLAPLRRFPAPTICAIEGVCLGGGLELALHCDIRIASISSKLGLPEVRVGMIPDVGGTTLLTRLVGPGRAAWLISTGIQLQGKTAYQFGLVERIVDTGSVMKTAREMAAEIAKGGPASVCAAIQAIRRIPGLSQEDASLVETEAGIEALTSGEALEGMMAFAEKRLPRW
jgi:enoyl-CoA hydratase/carnithine racemase